MRTIIQLLYLFLWLSSLHATTYSTFQSGDWHDPASWNAPGIPPNTVTGTDEIVINTGHIISFATFSNINFNQNSSLLINGELTLEVYQFHFNETSILINNNKLSLTNGSEIRMNENSSLTNHGMIVGGGLDINDIFIRINGSSICINYQKIERLEGIIVNDMGTFNNQGTIELFNYISISDNAQVTNIAFIYNNSGSDINLRNNSVFTNNGSIFSEPSSLINTYDNSTLYTCNPPPVYNNVAIKDESGGTATFAPIPAGNPCDDDDPDSIGDTWDGQCNCIPGMPILPGTIPVFEKQSNADNPLFNLSPISPSWTIDFVDLDGDGDLDLVSGDDTDQRTKVWYFENTGNAVNPNFSFVSSHAIYLLSDASGYIAPTWVDTDKDGDFELFLGSKDNGVNCYLNFGDCLTPVYGITCGNLSAGPLYSNISFVDIDMDGDQDAYIVQQSSTDEFDVEFYQNTGTPTSPVFSYIGINNPLELFSQLTVHSQFGGNIEFADLDQDGDQDAFFADGSGAIRYFPLVTIPFFDTTLDIYSEVTGATNPFNGVSGYRIYFADIDKDADQDAFILDAAAGGSYSYYENTTPKEYARFTRKVVPSLANLCHDYATTIALEDMDCDGDKDLIYNGFIGLFSSSTLLYDTETDGPMYYDNSTPLFLDFNDFPATVDIDGDEDYDLFGWSNLWNDYSYVENTGDAVQFDYTCPNVGDCINPIIPGFAFLGVPTFSFVDIDCDGDQDAFMAEQGYGVHFVRNDGNKINPSFNWIFGAANPFDGLEQGSDGTTLSFGDVDGDGDFDAIRGTTSGQIRYYENIGSPLSPQFLDRSNDINNPFFGLNPDGTGRYPHLADVDYDGDPDLFWGSFDDQGTNCDGEILFYTNMRSSCPEFLPEDIVIDQNPLPYQDFQAKNSISTNGVVQFSTGTAHELKAGMHIEVNEGTEVQHGTAVTATIDESFDECPESKYESGNGNCKIIKIASNTTSFDFSEIDNGKLVYNSYEDELSHIYLYNIKTGSRTKISNNKSTSTLINRTPRIAGNNIVWWGVGNNSHNIYLYNTLSTKITEVSTQDGNTSTSNISPQIDNQNIVWEGTIGAINSHIFLYNITSEVITNVSIQNGNSSNANSLPKIDGENIIWHGSDGGENHIYNYNISSGIVTKVSAQNSFNLISNCGAQIHNEHIVWHGFDGIDSHIFQYHIPTGTTTKISSLNGNISTNNSDPLITNDIIGWIGYFGTTRKLLIYDKATSSINTTDYNLHVASIFSIDGSKTLILGENSELIYNDQTKLTVLSFQTSHSCDITQSNIKLSDNKILFDNLIAGTHNLYLATCPCIEN